MPLILTRATLEMLLDDVVERTCLSLRVCMPARVVTWFPPVPGPRPTPPRALVQVDLRYARVGQIDEIDPAGLEVFKPASDPREPGELVGCYPLVLVPILYPGPWGMWIRGPLLVGELGVLFWCDRSLDSWQIEGGSPAGPVDPVFSHTHGGATGGPLNDAWFVPGARSGMSMSVGPVGTAPSVVDPVSWEIGTADGLSTLKITAPNGAAPIMMELKTAGATLTLDAAALVKVGALASQFLAKAPPLVQILTALATDISAWVPVTEVALKTAMMLPTGTVGRIIALAGTISCTKAQGE